MLELGKEYKIVTLEEDLEGLGEVQRHHCKVVEIAWPVVRFGWTTGDYMIVNLSSPHFVRAEPYD